MKRVALTFPNGQRVVTDLTPRLEAALRRVRSREVGGVRRRLMAVEGTLRETQRQLGERHVDGAIKRGAIAADKREKYLDLYARNPDAAREALASLPTDERRALANEEDAGWSDDDEAAWREHAVRNLGLREEDL